jgi:selenocysteine-specific elongation factor
MTVKTDQLEQVIVGTAGHVDHGKTALVKALTGVDADVLEEEKKRGMTIDLGFVFMDLPASARQIMFIDVPGHEKLVKTMVAGASNIDAALLVVAADDSIRPQTEEHIDILNLLGIQKGIVAITKSDLVDEKRIETVKEEIKTLLLAGTPLQNSPIIPVSSVTNTGIENLTSALVDLGKQKAGRYDNKLFRMPVDRVFSMKGFGAVVAGTVLAGEVAVGDPIEVYPDGLKTKVRGIQVNHKKVERSNIGYRTAVNLHNIEKSSLRRGQCIAKPGTLRPANRLDARLTLLKSASRDLKNRTRLRLHIGTDEVMARLILLDRDVLARGDSAIVQFMLEAPTVALAEDRFVIRTFSPIITIGGGTILDASARRHKRFDEETVQGLTKRESNPSEAVEQAFLKANFLPLSITQAAGEVGKQLNETTEITENLLKRRKIVKIGSRSQSSKYMHEQAHEELCIRLVNILEEFLSKNTYRQSMSLAEARSQFSRYAENDVFESVLAGLEGKKKAFRDEARIGLTNHHIQLSEEEQKFAEQIEKAYKEGGFKPPLQNEVRENLDISTEVFDNLMLSLVEQKRVVRINDEMAFSAETANKFQDIIKDNKKKKDALRVADLRDRLNTTRRYAKALLLHFAPELHQRQLDKE